MNGEDSVRHEDTAPRVLAHAILAVGVASVAFGSLLASAPSIRGLFKAALFEGRRDLAHVPFDLSNDPALGHPIKLPAAIRGALRELGSPSRLMIVLGGSCSDCSALSPLSIGKLAAAVGVPLLVLYRGGIESKSWYAVRAESAVLFLEDVNGQMHRSLNAVFQPRLALISASGTLLWLQVSPRLPDPASIRKIVP